MKELTGKPHDFMDEDGRTHHHPGYVYRLCKICGDAYYLAVTTALNYETCGKEACIKANGGKV